jgi:hypothetical protein
MNLEVLASLGTTILNTVMLVFILKYLIDYKGKITDLCIRVKALEDRVKKLRRRRK